MFKKLIIGLFIVSLFGLLGEVRGETEGEYDPIIAAGEQSNEQAKEADKNRSINVVPKVDLKKLIDKSSSFNVNTNLSLGHEGFVEINAKDEETNILHKALNLMIKVMGTLAVLLYVVGGFFYITSQGDENQIQKGKTILTYTSLGLAIAFASYLLVYIVMSATFTLS